MDKQRVDMYIMSNNKYFESHQIPALSHVLENTEESRFMRVQSLNLKDPILLLIISLVAGPLGVDRFVVGDVGLGIAKLLTCGGLGIWTIVDYFLIMGRARQVNYEKVQQAIGY